VHSFDAFIAHMRACSCKCMHCAHCASVRERVCTCAGNLAKLIVLDSTTSAPPKITVTGTMRLVIRSHSVMSNKRGLGFREFRDKTKRPSPLHLQRWKGGGGSSGRHGPHDCGFVCLPSKCHTVEQQTRVTHVMHYHALQSRH